MLMTYLSAISPTPRSATAIANVLIPILLISVSSAHLCYHLPVWSYVCQYVLNHHLKTPYVSYM